MRKTFLDKKVHVPAWFFLVMIIVGIFSYYGSEPLMMLMPQDKDGNIPREYSSIPVLMDIGGIGLMFFGFVCAKNLAEKQLNEDSKR